MTSLPDTLTPAETAVVSGVSIRDVHRVIDEQILPDSFYNTSQTRSIKSQACVFISFYFGSADRLTSEERQRTIARASQSPNWRRSNKVIRDGFLAVDLSAFLEGVQDRLQRLLAARAMVVSDPEILGGMPVIKGTRVPVYDVAANVAAGVATERILLSYPSLKHEQIGLAALYAEANPLRGRPRRRTPPEGARVVSRRVVPRTVHYEAAH